MEITLRPVKPSDHDFRWRLHNAALRVYVEKTWGWDEEWQRSDFAGRFDAATGQIIVVDGVDAGFWWVVEHETEILLASIHLLPEFQNHGIGTTLIRGLIDSTDKPVRLQVLKVNPARILYQRLGFDVFDETETHFKMIRMPAMM